MVFLQQPDLSEDSQGRITLGPLECVETSINAFLIEKKNTDNIINCCLHAIKTNLLLIVNCVYVLQIHNVMW